MTTLNYDQNRRDEILFAGHTLRYSGGIERFDHLTLDRLELLVAENFIDLEGSQNCSPTAGEFLDFMRVYPMVMAHGYAVSNERSDYRVTLEGLQCPAAKVTEELRLAFVDLCRCADDISFRGALYAWWD